MGSVDLKPSGSEALADFWSQVPDTVDLPIIRGILRSVVERVATEMAVRPPEFFSDATGPGVLLELVQRIPSELCTPDLPGLIYEQLIAAGDRRTRGAHFTPSRIADVVVTLAVEQLDVESCGHEIAVWDPAAGGGAFLLAAARSIERETGLARADIVQHIYASDIDPIALEVCGAALSLWCAGTATPTVHAGDAILDLPSDWPASFQLVVGNPPFLGQLSADTSRGASRRERLLATYENTAGGYVDESGLFLHVGLSRMGPGGVVALVLPESLLGARDAQAVRSSADGRASLAVLWIDEGQSFDAAVDVVAPVFTAETPDHEGTIVAIGASKRSVEQRPTAGTWSPLLAAARGVPVVRATTGGSVLADLATVTAGFRQHFYGLQGAVREASEDRVDRTGEQRLITTGVIDPLHLRWGERLVKFAGQRWKAPVVDVEAISDRGVQDWFAERCVPKLLLASQTKVLEVVVDETGDLLPSVPTLSVEPADEADLWRLAAVISSPWVSGWIAARSAGTGLSANAFRVRARDIAAVPLPAEGSAWQRGASLAATAQHAAATQDFVAYSDALWDLGETMMDAYGEPDRALIDWWWARLDVRARSRDHS